MYSEDERDQQWYAVNTAPQHKSSVQRHLSTRTIESFMHPCEHTRVWKNRQKTKSPAALFPGYVSIRKGHAYVSVVPITSMAFISSVATRPI